MRRTTSPRLRGSLAIAAIAILALAAFGLTGCACQPLDQPNTEPGGVESTGTVQAELPGEATSTPDATASVTPTTTPEPTTPTIWPSKVGTFRSKYFKKAVWYPTYIPKGYKIDTIDIVELDKGTGYICDIIYLDGDNMIQLMQGSPTERTYDIVSVEKVPWGTGQADVVHQDPEDTESPTMIVYSKGGTFIELMAQGPSLAELKKIAASMVPVK